jgi:hypothetical protein
MRTDLSDYQVPKEAVYHFCASIIKGLILNKHGGKTRGLVRIDQVALASVKDGLEGFKFQFKSFNSK